MNPLVHTLDADTYSLPGPGVESMGVVERTARDGAAWNPDGIDTPQQRDPQPAHVTGSMMPVQQVLRVPRAARHPLPMATTLHPVPDYNTFGGTAGTHGELTPGFDFPDGRQEDFSPQRRTFRTRTGAYDQGVYVGWVPGAPVGDA